MLGGFVVCHADGGDEKRLRSAGADNGDGGGGGEGGFGNADNGDVFSQGFVEVSSESRLVGGVQPYVMYW